MPFTDTATLAELERSGLAGPGWTLQPVAGGLNNSVFFALDAGRQPQLTVRSIRNLARLNGVPFPGTVELAWRWLRGRDAYLSQRAAREKAVRPEAAYCAEVVGVTLEAMGILEDDVPMNWYDPGRFWSGDSLPIRAGWSYGVEVGVLTTGQG